MHRVLTGRNPGRPPGPGAVPTPLSRPRPALCHIRSRRPGGPAEAPTGAEPPAPRACPRQALPARRSKTIRRFTRAAVIGAGILALSGLTAGAAQAIPRPPGFMIGDQYKEPSSEECMKDGHSWPIKEFTCVGPHEDGSWTLTITKL